MIFDPCFNQALFVLFVLYALYLLGAWVFSDVNYRPEYKKKNRRPNDGFSD